MTTDTTVCLRSASPELPTLTSVCSNSILGFFFFFSGRLYPLSNSRQVIGPGIYRVFREAGPRTCKVLICTMAIMRSAKPRPPFLLLICPATAARLHKSSSPYLKILVPVIFFLKTRRSSKNLTRGNLNKALFIPTRFQSHAIL